MQNAMEAVQKTYHLTLDSDLEHARKLAPRWMAEFEDSALHVPGAADLAHCADLAARAPTLVLQGYVLGLLINN